MNEGILKLAQQVDVILSKGDELYLRWFPKLTFRQFAVTFFIVSLLCQAINSYSYPNPFLNPLFIVLPILSYVILGWILFKIYCGHKKIFKIYSVLLILNIFSGILSFVEYFFISMPIAYSITTVMYTLLVIFELFFLRDFWRRKYSVIDLTFAHKKIV